MLFINFKTYPEATGVKAVELVRVISLAQAKTGVPIFPVVQSVDIRSCMIATNYEVWAQHVDGEEQGKHNGWITPEAAGEAGASGTFLNHSEHKLKDDELKKANERCKGLGLKTMIFASDVEELKKVVGLKPDFVAYEPPELIASKDTSVAKAEPGVIGKAAEIAKGAGVPLIVGAGVKDIGDVKGSLKEGSTGVAASSAVILAKDPKKVILELAKGFQK
ncbi:triose-phosphate isomerase [Candidatus Woesebacteria bacterium]|nr:triose-phosphate isomerase [Candidatus Woesebacteria bacterium]